MKNKKELDVAIAAAKASGKVLQKYYKKNIRVETKDNKTPVTIADRESEKTIVSVIRKRFSDHDFLGEEFQYANTNSECKWIIDPLDGTKNFVRGTPFFGNCIAFEKKGQIVVGAICMPELNLIAYASKGSGAFINGKKARASGIKQLEEAFIVFGDVDTFHDKGYGIQFLELVKRCEQHRGYGDTIGYILLAQGSVDIVLDTPAPWDVAAAKIIVEEAGGKFTDFHGTNTIYAEHTIATNGKLHDEVIKILKR